MVYNLFDIGFDIRSSCKATIASDLRSTVPVARSSNIQTDLKPVLQKNTRPLFVDGSLVFNWSLPEALPCRVGQLARQFRWRVSVRALSVARWDHSSTLPRFQQPLVKPDMKFSLIRLS